MTLTNVGAIFLVSAEIFQRLGALWVAILVLLFGFLRITLNALQEAIVAEQDLKGLTSAESKFGFLRAIAPSEESFSKITEPEFKNDLARFFQALGAQLHKKVYPAELILFAVATLQWGFGDLFHCFINGNGWKTC